MGDETQDAKAIYGQALEMESPRQRSAYLDRASACVPQVETWGYSPSSLRDLILSPANAGGASTMPLKPETQAKPVAPRTPSLARQASMRAIDEVMIMAETTGRNRTSGVTFQ